MPGPLCQVSRCQSSTDHWRPGGGPRARESAAARDRRATSASSLVAARATAPGESPIVEERAHSAHNSSCSEISQQQSQRISLTEAVTAKHSSFEINKSIPHLEPVSLTMLVCVLRLRVSDQVD